MERVDLIVKSIFGVCVGIISIFTDLFGLMFTVLLGLMALDFISGVLAGAVNEGLRSSTGIKGLIKKVYIILLVGAVFMIEVAVVKSNGVATDGISAAFAFAEFISIVENGGKLGIPMPDKLKDLITTLKNKNKKV